ncbi:MAG TPA: bifunctional UDP-N-acetylglucosamine diphosphorylase/glucosamine-1-phosphate N-acetyltransferase GlmU [Bacillales bacterium]|nr:bifunctional UDP-N-acetylglucosamine diphosphorylase/glucosamine-1-phosphate N-acetyltransferase GlmU [Bacillales bacterium]
MAQKRYAVILAAGEGTRMKSKLYKVLHPVCGKPMVQHVVDEAVRLGTDQVVTVVGRGAGAVQDQLGDTVDYAIQEEQLGTAHAVMQAEDQLGALDGITVVLYGDTPLITKETIEALIEDHEKNGAKATILTSHVNDPYGYGRVIRGEGNMVKRVVEEKDATAEERQIGEINTGIYCFDNRSLFKALKHVNNENEQKEYYLPDVLEILQHQGESVRAYQTDDFTETLGVNNRVQLARAERVMQRRINESHMLNGVTMIDPDSVYISADVKIGPDTVIYPGSYLSGKTIVGSECVIGPQSELQDAAIGNGTLVKQSVVHDSFVGNGVKIGPFAHIRPDSEIGDQAKIGNFVEIKKSKIGNGSKASHLGYIGDAEIGQNVNFSCGAITVNYDGTHKHLTRVGDGAFIGCNVNLVAPVTIEKNAFVAAGSTITDTVPEESLAIARSRQTTKENYVQKLKQRKGL